MVEKIVYVCFPISLSDQVSLVVLVELEMLSCDVIFCMDWFHACYASVDCRTCVIKFLFLNKHILEWKGGNCICRVLLVSYLKARKMISEECITILLG